MSADSEKVGVGAIRAVLEQLADAAESFAADQGRATDKRCGLVQPVTVAQAEALNVALRKARAWLDATADDGEPTTETWLRAAGAETHCGRLCLGEQLQFTHCGGWNAWWAINGVPHASSRLVDGLNTRGQVRRLCAILGVALRA